MICDLRVCLQCLQRFLKLNILLGVPCQIFHLGECRYTAIKTMNTSFIMTMNMLGLAKCTSARFLLTSTSEVGGS